VRCRRNVREWGGMSLKSYEIEKRRTTEPSGFSNVLNELNDARYARGEYQLNVSGFGYLIAGLGFGPSRELDCSQVGRRQGDQGVFVGSKVSHR